MAYTIYQRRKARQDILNIVDYIADENPAAALAVFEAYEYSLQLLRTTPDMGRVYRSGDPRLANIRMLPMHRFPNYLIFSRRSGQMIEVLHVWHGARDINALLPDMD